jgi:hypothetical protein
MMAPRRNPRCSCALSEVVCNVTLVISLNTVMQLKNNITLSMMLDSTELLTGFQPKNPLIVEGGFHILPPSY